MIFAKTPDISTVQKARCARHRPTGEVLIYPGHRQSDTVNQWLRHIKKQRNKKQTRIAFCCMAWLGYGLRYINRPIQWRFEVNKVARPCCISGYYLLPAGSRFIVCGTSAEILCSCMRTTVSVIATVNQTVYERMDFRLTIKSIEPGKPVIVWTTYVLRKLASDNRLHNYVPSYFPIASMYPGRLTAMRMQIVQLASVHAFTRP